MRVHSQPRRRSCKGPEVGKREKEKERETEGRGGGDGVPFIGTHEKPILTHLFELLTHCSFQIPELKSVFCEDAASLPARVSGQLILFDPTYPLHGGGFRLLTPLRCFRNTGFPALPKTPSSEAGSPHPPLSRRPSLCPSGLSDRSGTWPSVASLPPPSG